MVNAVVLAFACSVVPAAAMMLGSLLLTRIKISERLLAAFQNLSAGLVLAAVAAELFPLLGSSTDGAQIGGLTVGFVCGLLVVFGVERLGEVLEVRNKREERHAPLLVDSALALSALSGFRRRQWPLAQFSGQLRGWRCYIE
jgi:hypothetical protein